MQTATTHEIINAYIDELNERIELSELTYDACYSFGNDNTTAFALGELHGLKMALRIIEPSLETVNA